MTRSITLGTLPAFLLASATPLVAAQAEQPASIEFGSDASEWSNDGECDDPRFAGEGMAASLVTDNIGRDASDCRKAFEGDRIALHPMFAEPSDMASVQYGDDGSAFANDGACDDIRFTGDYAGEMVYLVGDIGHDASDCRAAMQSGEARWQGGTINPNHGIRIDDIMSVEDAVPGDTI